MKRSKRPAPAEPVRAWRPKLWHYALGLLLALLAAFEVYQPALRGPFLFDDIYLPVADPAFATEALRNVVRGVRPLLMLSFWLQARALGAEPDSCHVINLLFHVAASVLAGLIVRRLAGWSGQTGWQRETLAVFAGALFLLHPLQTESVAYVAGRSESQSVLFFYAACAAFLYRRSTAITFPGALLVLALFGAAFLTKEHCVVLPAFLLLADYFWNPGFNLEGIRRNWRLYVPIAAGAVLAVALVWKVLRGAESAGFGMKDLSWYQYFFTQCRAIWTYIRLFFLPYGQNVDYPFPISRTLLEHGAIAGLLGLAALVAAAVYYRRRFPLASFGVLAFLILLAPTSSFVPIKDPLADRRMYLPMIGLLCVVVDFLASWKTSKVVFAGALAAALLTAGSLTYRRNQVWSSPIALWEDSVAAAPQNWRAHFHLAFAYYQDNHCPEAVEHYEIAVRLGSPVDSRLLVDWALACDCANKPGEALGKLLQAAAIEKTAHVYSLIGMICAKQGKRAEAFEALETAQKLDQTYAPTYVYRGNLYRASEEFAKAAEQYRRALSLNPQDEIARRGLEMAEAQLRRKP